MRGRDKLRSLRDKLRPAPRPATADEGGSGSASRSPPASSLFPVMLLVDHADGNNPSRSPPLAVYVSLSTDLRLLAADSRPTPPSSLLDFRHPDRRLGLKRLPHPPPPSCASDAESALSADAQLARRAAPDDAHMAGPAVRISDGKRALLLIAATERERDAFLSSLRLRVAPWALLRERMDAEMLCLAPSIADAAREFVSGAAGAAGDAEGMWEERGAEAALRVWERAGKVAEMSIWTATAGQRIGGVARTAEELKRLTKPLAGLTVVGCTFSLVALTARVVSLIAMERGGREGLVKAQGDLREAAVELVGWLLSILMSGFRDGDGLVGKVFDVLGECWDAAGGLEMYVLRNWTMRVWKADEVRSIIADVDSVKGKLLGAGLLKVAADHEGRINRLEGQAAGAADEFRPFAPNVAAFGDGLVASAATSLVQLKAAVLPPDSAGDGSTAVGESSAAPDTDSSLHRVSLTSINGEGGVGKIATCKLLCADRDVRAYFSGGAIIWIEVGRVATREKVANELGRAAFVCGGKQRAEEIRSSPDIFEAVDLASQFFAEHRILVVLDNVWEAPADRTSGVVNWATTLSKIASHPGSAVIMTTRFNSLSESRGFSRVHLGRLDLTTDESPDWRIAEQLYDARLGSSFDEQSSDAYKKDRKNALEITCGLPLGIETFVGVVRNRLQMGHNVRSVLAKIKKRALGLAREAVGDELEAQIGHCGLFAGMEESLSHLDEHKASSVKSPPLAERIDADGNDTRVFRASYYDFPGKALSSRYAALEMMPASSRILSFPVLCRLWHVRDVEQAEEIALLFFNVGLARIDRGSSGEENLFSLHDLQYSYCAHDLCMGEESVGATANGGSTAPASPNGHALFLSSCESLLGPGKAGSDVGMGWISFCFSRSILSAGLLLPRYVAQNLFRHLLAAALVVDDGVVLQAMLDMLTDFRWLRGRIASDGRSAAVSDCSYALESCHATKSIVDAQRLTARKTIRALRQCLMLVRDGVSMECDGMLGVSLVQLTLSAGLDAGLLSKLNRSVENEIHGSWLKPVSGCSIEREGFILAEAVVGNGRLVRSLAVLGDELHFVSGSLDGVVRMHECVDLETVLALRGHVDEVNCVSVARKEGFDNAFLIYSADDSGVVQVWEVSVNLEQHIVNEEGSAVVGECGNFVSYLAVSRGGGRIVTGCGNGEVFIWEQMMTRIPRSAIHWQLALVVPQMAETRVLSAG